MSIKKFLYGTPAICLATCLVLIAGFTITCFALPHQGKPEVILLFTLAISTLITLLGYSFLSLLCEKAAEAILFRLKAAEEKLETFEKKVYLLCSKVSLKGGNNGRT